MKSANARFDRCLAEVFKHEGGFSNHPRDRGGPTKYGITLRTLAQWRGVDPEDLSEDAVRALTRDEARLIYMSRYWVPVRGDDLPPGVDLAVFDFAVNSGVTRASRMLQAVVGETQDGVIGRRTLAAVARMPADDVINDLCGARLTFLRGLENWRDFGRGWERRVESVRNVALQWAREGLPIGEVARTDTAKAATATAGAVTAAAVVLQEAEPILAAVAPWLDRYGMYGALAAVTLIVLAAVWRWRAKRG